MLPNHSDGDSRQLFHFSSDALMTFLAKCTLLEELSISMTEEFITTFMDSVLPKVPNLYVLMLPTGYIADLRPAAKDSDNERSLMNELREQERLALARKLFQSSRKIARKSTESALRYIGIGTHVYCCMLPFTDLSTDPSYLFTIA